MGLPNHLKTKHLSLSIKRKSTKNRLKLARQYKLMKEVKKTVNTVTTAIDHPPDQLSVDKVTISSLLHDEGSEVRPSTSFENFVASEEEDMDYEIENECPKVNVSSTCHIFTTVIDHPPEQPIVDKVTISSTLHEKYHPEVRPSTNFENFIDNEEEDGMDYEIEKECPKVNVSSACKKDNTISGRRIVNIAYLFQQLSEIGCHKPFSCNISNMQLVSEKRNGLQSTFKLKCSFCNITREIYSDEVTSDTMSINDSAILACISIGNGYSQMTETHAAMDIPPMSNHKFLSISTEIGEVIRKTAWESMKEAGVEEARMAREMGCVDENGTPLITVVADGAWCKRSYKVNYNASSGVGCIIGYQTGKLLYLGIRNKYCTLCSKSEAEGVDPVSHKCFKNWNGSSTSMESDIIIEGFSKSLEVHGLIFSKLIGDGDSSVTKKLAAVKPYGCRLVEKIECRNHLLRNFCCKLKELVQKRSSSKNIVVPVALRKCLEGNIRRLRTAVTKAVLYRKTQNTTIDEKINNLKKDLLNAPSHIFGEHLKCTEIAYFCSKTIEDPNKVEDMKLCGLYDDIMYCMYRLIHNAHSLILDMDNNAAELYNAVLCKFVGGKRINFALRSSYQTRCEAAGLSYNSGGKYYYNIHKAITQRSPGQHTKKFIAKQVKNRTYYSKRKLFIKECRKKKLKTVAEADEEYGFPEIPDLPDNVIDEKKKVFLDKLNKNEMERIQLEVSTRGQSSNPLWRQERISRLTASSFGKICKLRPTTSCAKTVENLLYKEFFGNAATRYGIEHEPAAIAQFSELTNLKVQSCGLFVDEKYSFLGASPDGVISNTDANNCIVEVKCPAVASKMTVKEAINAKKIKFATINGNKLFLKPDHDYMFQIQGQLHITKKMFCYFVVWTPLDLQFQKIERDEKFWETKMENKLSSFYLNCLLPEIVDSRYTRKMPIRNLQR